MFAGVYALMTGCWLNNSTLVAHQVGIMIEQLTRTNRVMQVCSLTGTRGGLNAGLVRAFLPMHDVNDGSCCDKRVKARAASVHPQCTNVSSALKSEVLGHSRFQRARMTLSREVTSRTTTPSTGQKAKCRCSWQYDAPVQLIKIKKHLLYLLTST